MVMKKRFWLRASGLRWQEVTECEFIKAERAAEFRPKIGCGIATSGFHSGAVEGRVTHGEITEENYGRDQDFLEVARDKK